jgi:deazaflavin-dependent oxidoreductase (nitroreductase family)
MPNPPGPTDPIDTSLLNAEHVRVYRETNGATGYEWNGAPILLLTTKGRKSGEPRTIAIIYAEKDGVPHIIGSQGGAPVHPHWYLNILQDPNVQVQIKDRVFDATARPTESPEREARWAESLKTWPRYDVYQARTSRRIPVVALEPK